jgi:polar amino acid transport system substrate-binding protein
MKRYAVMAGAAAIAALSAVVLTQPTVAQDNAKLEQLKAQGFARVAIANEPPFTAVAADGKVSGAAPDVARAVFAKLGVPEIVASISEYGAMIPGLQAGRHDVVTAGLFMKPERCAAVVYSEPVLCDAEAFAGEEGQPAQASRATRTSRPIASMRRSARRAVARKRSWRSTLACRATASSWFRTARAA